MGLLPQLLFFSFSAFNKSDINISLAENTSMEGQAGQVPVLLLFRESREFLVVGVYITDVRLPRPPIVDILYHMLSPNNVDISHSKTASRPPLQVELSLGKSLARTRKFINLSDGKEANSARFPKGAD